MECFLDTKGKGRSAAAVHPCSRELGKEETQPKLFLCQCDHTELGDLCIFWSYLDCWLDFLTDCSLLISLNIRGAVCLYRIERIDGTIYSYETSYV